MTFLPGTRAVCQRRLARCSIIFLSENQELNVSSSLLIFIHMRSQQWITRWVSYCCRRGPETTAEVPRLLVNGSSLAGYFPVGPDVG